MRDRERFIYLGWKILEHKYRYYELSSPTVEDYAFDMMQKEYETLAEKLGEPPTAVDMVDFDASRPSCRSAMERVKFQDMDRRKRDRWLKGRYGSI